jgi:ribonuclease E
MLSTENPLEREPIAAPQLDIPEDPGLNGEADGGDTTLAEEQVSDWEPSFEEGAFGLRADAARKQEDDDDDDSDFGFDDFDYDDETDEEEELEDDLDEDEDDELDDDFDDFEDSGEP